MDCSDPALVLAIALDLALVLVIILDPAPVLVIILDPALDLDCLKYQNFDCLIRR